MSTTTPNVTRSLSAKTTLIAVGAASAILFAGWATATGYVDTPTNAVGWAATAATNPLMTAIEGGVVGGKLLAHQVAGH